MKEDNMKSFAQYIQLKESYPDRFTEPGRPNVAKATQDILYDEYDMFLQQVKAQHVDPILIDRMKNMQKIWQEMVQRSRRAGLDHREVIANKKVARQLVSEIQEMARNNKNLEHLNYTAEALRVLFDKIDVNIMDAWRD